MVDTIKFSQMTDGGDLANNEKVPGLLGGANVLFNNPWTFLPPGNTADRPAPSSDINYRLRFNTEDQLYEYYDAVNKQWTQLQKSTFTFGPFVTYEADPGFPTAQNLGLLTAGLLKQTVMSASATLAIAVNAVDYWAPGGALTRNQVPTVGNDVTNKTYVDGLDFGNVKSVTGTANKIDVDNTDPANPILSLPSTVQISDSILDANLTKIIELISIVSAQNYLQITNSAGTNKVILSAVGGGAFTGLQFKNQGGAQFLFDTTATSPLVFTSGPSSQHTSIFTLPTSAASSTYTFQNGTGTLLMTGQAISTVPSIAFSSTSGVIGTTTNDNAAAGSVGEFISSVINLGSKITLTTATATNITSISLTAGDWDIAWGLSFETEATTSLVLIQGGNALTNPGIPLNSPVASQFVLQWSPFVPGIATFQQNGARARQSLSTTTTIYLNVSSAFTIANLFAYGWISARRVR